MAQTEAGRMTLAEAGKKGFISGSLKDRKVEAKHTCKASNFLLPYDYLGICFSAHPIPLFHSF
jgi:hypothetical protein